MDVIIGLGDVLVALVGLAVTSVLLALLCRRVLGVPVGWPRSIIIGGGAYLFAFPLLYLLLNSQGLFDGYQFVGDPAEAVFLMLLGGIVIFTIALVMLVIAEVIIPTGTVGNPLNLIRDTRARMRRGRRYAQVMAILAKHGLSAWLRIGGRGATGERRPRPAGRPTARSLADAFAEAGVTFVKLGQTLSSRPDIVPEAYVRELSRLQDDAAPVPWSTLEPVLAADLPGPIEEVFSEVDPDPLATASIGQVHGARLVDGTPVVIKIRRPSAPSQVGVDLDIMIRLADRLERAADWARSIGAVRLTRGFADSLLEELDYRIEADNLAAVAATLSDSVVGVPRAYPELSGASLLIMDRVPGTPLGQADDLLQALPDDRRSEIAGQLLTTVLRQILVTGVFHSDLHPGNIFLDDDGHLTLLDFGSVGRLDQPSRTALGLLLLAVDRDDPIGATDALTELLDHAEGRPGQRQLERDLGQLIVRYRGGLGTNGGAGMFAALWRLISNHRFSVPPQVAAAMRALAALESSVRMISPDTDIVAAARAEGAAYVGEVTDVEAMRARAESELFRLLPVLQRLPQRVNRIADDLESGRFSANLRVLADSGDRAFLSRLVGQLSMAIVAAAAVLSAIVLIISDAGPAISAGLRLYPVIGALLAFFGIVLGLRVMVVALRATDPDR